MTALSHPYSFTAGTTITASEVNSNFTATRSVINGQLADDNFASTAGQYTAYRSIIRAVCPITADQAAGTYFLAHNSASVIVVQSGTDVDNMPGVPFVYLDDADYTISGRNTRLRVRGAVSTNATQPTITFTFGLYPVTFAGGADALTATLGAVVASSTAAVASPAASGTTRTDSADFAVPADGLYALGVVTSGTLTNNNSSYLTADLQLHWT